MEIYLRLAAAAALPALLSAFFSILDRRFSGGKWGEMTRQLVIGLVFGVLAVSGPAFGVVIQEAEVSVQDAAPLCAGLFFGWPAGVLSGILGGAGRLLSVQWGAESFVAMACALSALLAGCAGGLFRRFLFENRAIMPLYGLMIAVVVEVIHLMLIFLTNMSEVSQSFQIIFYSALPLLVANAASVFAANFAVFCLSRKERSVRRHHPSITQLVQRWLMGALVIGFVVTCLFTFLLLTRLAEDDTDSVLALNISDVNGELKLMVNDYMLSMANQVTFYGVGDYMLPLADMQESDFPDADQSDSIDQTDITALLQTYCTVNQFQEINIVNKDGIICQSNDPRYIGFDMTDESEGNAQARDFYEHLQEMEYYAQDATSISYDTEMVRKYAGLQLPEDCYLSGGGGFIQVGYDEEGLYNLVAYQMTYVAAWRHVGGSGQIFICKEAEEPREKDGAHWELVSETDLRFEFEKTDENEVDDTHLEDVGLDFDPTVLQEGIRFTGTVDGVSCYCMYQEVDGFYLIATIPVHEALTSRDNSVLMMILLETLIFVSLFAMVYLCMKKVVVDNIQRVNTSLNQITEGNLDVSVSVRSNQEFEMLSNGINFTVERLKQFISEAAARLDQELEFARVIQHAALPSIFPPYPNREDFDIWASMSTANEVGGDFYDFYLLGEDRLAFLVADVSDKGVPAAMFMMTAKTQIKSLAETGLSVGEILTQANAKLCENNEGRMFVTAWMGILDLKTGMMTYANAGHNPPLVRCGEEDYRYQKSRASLVLGGMEFTQYRENQLQLHPGDQIFLYTDGVTEATNTRGVFYGEERLLADANSRKELAPETFCKEIKAQIDEFAGEAPQYDDITMLCLRYCGQAATRTKGAQ